MPEVTLPIPYRILDRRGEPYQSSTDIINKSVYNIDPFFWQYRTGSTAFAVRQIEREPYKWHAWVYACAKSIINNIATLPHVLYSRKDESKFIYDHEVLDLLDNPNDFQHGSDLFEAILLNLLLPTIRSPGGQCFIIGDMGKVGQTEYANFRRGDIPLFLYVYSDNTIKAIKDKVTGWIQGWQFQVGGVTKETLSNDEIIRIRFANPYDLALGMSPYASSQVAVIQDIKADEWNTKIYDNAGRVDGIIKTEQGVTQEQAKEILKAWNDNYGGAGNNSKTALLPLGLQYEQFMRSNLDMQFTEQKKMNKEQVMGAYGVPESELAVYNKGMNKATAAQADKNFWQKTLLPIDRKIWSTFNHTWIRNVQGRDLRGMSDLSTIEALQKDLQDKATTAKIYFDMGAPAAECFKAVGAPIEWEKYPWLERYFVNGTMVDVENIIGKQPIAPDTSAPEIEQEPEEEPAEGETGEKSITVGRAMRTLISTDYIAKVLEASEKQLRKELADKFFIRQKNIMLEKIDKWAKDHAGDTLGKCFQDIDPLAISNENDIRLMCGMHTHTSKHYEKHYDIERAYIGNECTLLICKATIKKVDPSVFMINLSDETDALEKLLKPYYKDQMYKEKDRVESELGSSINWDVTPDNINEMLSERQSYIEGINEVTINRASDRMYEVIADAIDDGDSISQTAQALKDAVGFAMNGRAGNAVTIARTEISSIASASRNALFAEAEIEKTQWVSAGDERVRETHQEEDGNVAELGEVFPITGLEYPCQAGGDEEEVINCRCIVVPYKEE